jgi:hypothetical protein
LIWLVKKSRPFKEADGHFPCSQQSGREPFSKPDESSAHIGIIFLLTREVCLISQASSERQLPKTGRAMKMETNGMNTFLRGSVSFLIKIFWKFIL